jgi:cytochrome c-type biogenesis protein CcmH/NrfG
MREGIESALRYDPSVPLARLLLAGVLLREDENKKPEERDPSSPQRATFLREYDLKRLPDDAGLWIRAAKSLAEQKDFKRSQQAAEKALKLDPLNAEAKTALEAAMQGGGE